MSHNSIRVADLSKRFVRASLGASQYRTFAEAIAEAVTAPVRNFGHLRGRATETDSFWALKDVSIEIPTGQVTGIIGRNGAGKSTLLKIISRITDPTRGRVHVRGRVASLLEVGTGFHNELTGRENVYMNGAILGMTRREIEGHFDQIVSFSGVERFIDTPVKRYSTGMYLRLAFAVAAHLEPEILIVDEVLAVGDMEFQRKCLARMRQVAQGGRTVLLVSHNMTAIESLCSTCALLEDGKLVRYGPTAEVTRAYRSRMPGYAGTGSVELTERDVRSRKRPVFRHADLLEPGGATTLTVSSGGAFLLRLTVDLPECADHPHFVVRIDDAHGNRAMTVRNHVSQNELGRMVGRCQIECRIERLPLAPGEYWLGLGYYVNEEIWDSLERILCFQVEEGHMTHPESAYGLCVAPSEWILSS